MNYFYLIYCSVPARRLSDEEVEELLLVARRENKLRDITGMLLCLPEMYVQLIEGAEADIRQLYLNLSRDQRHHTVTILKEGHLEQRFFPDWSMGYDQKSVTLTNAEDSFCISDEKVFALFEILDEGFG
ncbi:BLUF domain-containing protein [Paradesertivirga mongoliensis]|uniref:BLUF domain-containing protein n=1 Tax=Paradesertivirga mongoliensis TaxID=2100740 RepID=A0ABW4ZPP0_9SPHI|nr:BLUF domain-containing protein [Pedobacter mongoliensis]